MVSMLIILGSIFKLKRARKEIKKVYYNKTADGNTFFFLKKSLKLLLIKLIF